MLTLKKFEDLDGLKRLVYELEHSTPGRDGSILRADLVLYIRHDRSWCELKVDECKAEIHGDALDKMAIWLRRLADGIDQRNHVTIPM